MLQAGLDDTIAKESMYINKSLSYLEQVVVALTTKSRAHIPYRQTKLTHVLKAGLLLSTVGCDCRAPRLSERHRRHPCFVLIAMISPPPRLC